MAIAIALQFLTERKRPNNINSARCQVRDLCKGHLNAEFANRNGVPVSKKNCSLVGSHSYRKSPLCIRKSSASHQWVNRFGKKTPSFHNGQLWRILWRKLRFFQRKPGEQFVARHGVPAIPQLWNTYPRHHPAPVSSNMACWKIHHLVKFSSTTSLFKPLF